MAHKPLEHWSDNKRIEVVTTYLILGKIPLVEAATGVPPGTIRRWKTEPWWLELVTQIQADADQELDTKLAKRIDKALEIVNDRLENGDFQYDPKTGAFVRKPVGLRDTWRVTSEMVDKRMLLRKQPKDTTSQEAVGDILKNLAREFADMAKRRLTEKVIEHDEPVESQAQLPA